MDWIIATFPALSAILDYNCVFKLFHRNEFKMLVFAPGISSRPDKTGCGLLSHKKRADC
jgi:hypothetical protein